MFEFGIGAEFLRFLIDMLGLSFESVCTVEFPLKVPPLMGFEMKFGRILGGI